MRAIVDRHRDGRLSDMGAKRGWRWPEVLICAGVFLLVVLVVWLVA